MIEVSASREEIATTKENISKIKELVLNANYVIEKYITTQLNKSKKITEITKIVQELSENFSLDHKFQGYSFYNQNITHENFKDVSLTTFDLTYRGKLRKTLICHNENYYRNKNVNTNNLFYFDNSESLVKRNKRIKEYLTTNKTITVLELTNSDKKYYTKFIKDLNFVDLKTIEYPETVKTKQPRVKRANKEFCLHGIDTYYGIDKKYTTLATNTKKWYYVEMEKGSLNHTLEANCKKLLRNLALTFVDYRQQMSLELNLTKTLLSLVST